MRPKANSAFILKVTRETQAARCLIVGAAVADQRAQAEADAQWRRCSPDEKLRPIAVYSEAHFTHTHIEKKPDWFIENPISSFKGEIVFTVWPCTESHPRGIFQSSVYGKALLSILLALKNDTSYSSLCFCGHPFTFSTVYLHGVYASQNKNNVTVKGCVNGDVDAASLKAGMCSAGKRITAQTTELCRFLWFETLMKL